MLPKIVSPSELRKQLALFLSMAASQAVVVTDKPSNKVIIDEKEYSRLSALAHQFTLEDPEGKYRPAFEKEILNLSKKPKYDNSVKSLSDLL